MKQNYIVFCFLIGISFLSFSQKEAEKTSGIFYKLSLATTLTINKDYTLGNDEGETFINPSALFVNNTVGYQFDQRSLIGLNFEYDWHSQQGLHFAPAFLSFQYNVITDDTNLFLRSGYGTLLGLGKSFEKGNMYRLGVGIEDVYFDTSFLFGLDFTRKRFGYKTLEGISSVSIFLEFKFF
ncbi:MAG: hypothetical protein GW839_08720 [Flavobacteriales bacterium]|nr:hypothetical protein [Flavobacteriia bacterium]NCP06989.1 hypothetical protein [Flavobacteriales bacterium]PIV94587.1 MAG: hypothetical protein COW44_03445 [Flavobacteriaceae bacterium CG17_big_fil_post_rev_8_21_14_2_50_33_15]PIY13431.1 MAG: hypothetical protein COZ17_00545 [Flavobacteriaceae bacterium CG_4_10_14_3_um_filter_33_47]PJB18730.1 MAG: hypothetical protein CO117_07325 [Flavobacteriaceae bacterium CG_4_9_14_3_um_filter_33_16]